MELQGKINTVTNPMTPSIGAIQTVQAAAHAGVVYYGVFAVTAVSAGSLLARAAGSASR